MNPRFRLHPRLHSTTAKIQVLALAAAGCLGSFGLAEAQTVRGDRGNDVNVTFPAALLMQNGGPILDVTKPPEKTMHAAVGDGVTDDTPALQDAYDLIRRRYEAAGGFASEVRFYIYLPNGTYLVNDTILYRGEPIKLPDTKWDICHVKFVGQSRAKTILRLADHAPAFQDPAHPKPVLTVQHPSTEFNNGPADNYVRNLTIDVGKGNPGAVGLVFQGANQTDLHNLSIVSEDGAGPYGIWFKQGSIQGYFADITVQGFDYGIYDAVNPEGDPAFEYLTLKGQNLAGIRHTGGALSLRQVLSDQSAHGATSLQLEGSGAQTVLVDSAFDGGKSSNPAVDLMKEEGECLFARHVTTTGYGPAVLRAGKEAVPAGEITEYVTSPVTTLFDGQKTASLDLPVEDTPLTPWYDPDKDWAIVDNYKSVQEALNSGKPVVVFKQRKYKLTGNLSLPPTVKVVKCLGAEVQGGDMMVDQAAPDPVAFEDGGMTVRVTAQRNVVERCFSHNIANPNALPVTFYLENVNDCASGDQFCPAGAKVFARQIDVEYRNVPQIVCAGGKLWVFGFKTENAGLALSFVVKNGGSLEVLGGYVNMLDGATSGNRLRSIVTNVDSNASVTCSTNMIGLYTLAVKEIRGDTTHTAPSADFPSRGNNYHTNFNIPLYVGGKAN